MTEKIMLVETIEDIIDDGEVVGKLCSNRAGDQVKVKKGQGGGLIKKWDELKEGLAYKFIMGEYKPPGKTEAYPYVKDFETVASTFVREAAEKVADAQADNKNKSYALSYAKDITVALVQAGKLKEINIDTPKTLANTTIAMAKQFNTYLMSSSEIVGGIKENIEGG